jgi:hypothetical protein
VKKSNKNIISASAMGYAISFLLMVGMVCSGVLFLSSTNKRIELNYELEEHLIFDNLFSLNYGASQGEIGTQKIIHPSGDTSIIVIKEWGMLRSIVATTFHRNRSLRKAALSSVELDHAFPALYTPDRRNELKLCGETRLEGDVYTAERGLKRGTIAKKRYSGDQLIYGTLKKSEKYLPPLRKSIRDLKLENYIQDATKVTSISKDSSYSFTEKTSLFSTSERLYVSNNLSGNLILHSSDTIVVSNGVSLQNIILLANSIRFERGFVGAVQAIADHQITCEQDVKLNYPSALILNEKSGKIQDENSQIFIGVIAQIIGGVLLMSQDPNFRKPVTLKVSQGTIGGLVYNQGETEIQGKIIGSLYTQKFILHAGGGVYGDHIMDATISSTQLPDDFIMPNWLDGIKPKKSVLITCF